MKNHIYKTTSPAHGNKSVREVLKAKVLLLMITAFLTLCTSGNALALCKQSQQLASGWHSTPLLVGNVYPMPAVDNANLDISVYQEGNLQVSLYDLAGSKVADLMDISATANTDYSIQMRLGFLSNGVYTIMITLDNERIFKQLIINK